MGWVVCQYYVIVYVQNMVMIISLQDKASSVVLLTQCRKLDPTLENQQRIFGHL